MNITGKTIIGFFIVIIGCFVLGLSLFPIETSNTLYTVVAITALTATASFLFGLVTNDYSWTDRLWSTTPVGYAWIYAYAGSFNTAVTTTAVLVTIWGARLTFNFARRDGYTGGEDYRWPILRNKIGNPLYWQLFNLLFIAVYQQALFIFFTLPLFVLSQTPGASMGPFAWIGVLLMLSFLTIETVADQQQYTFQQSKYGLMEKQKDYEEDYKKGFKTGGLFAISRHPNYLGELGVWWSIYLIGAANVGSIFHWSILGPIMLTLLFMGSTIFTEGITKEKYPEYGLYQKKVWPIFPKLWR
jgi:steroid 5-alpha reductase family enzyme